MRRPFHNHSLVLDTEGNVKATVETWYDRRSRNWITQIKDRHGNQSGSALFAGTREGAASNQASAEAEARDTSTAI